MSVIEAGPEHGMGKAPTRPARTGRVGDSGATSGSNAGPDLHFGMICTKGTRHKHP